MRWVGENSSPKVAAKPPSSSLNGRPKKLGRGMLRNAVRSAGDALPVEQHEADDLAEGERDDGEIVAAQPQHRKAEQDAPERGEDAGERQADPERQLEVRGEQRVGIGADRVERDVAEIEQAGEADHDVEAPAEHHIGQDEDAEIEQVAVVIEQHRHQQREDQQRRRGEAACHAQARASTHDGIAPPNRIGPRPKISARHERADEHRADHHRELGPSAW